MGFNIRRLEPKGFLRASNERTPWELWTPSQTLRLTHRDGILDLDMYTGYDWRATIPHVFDFGESNLQGSSRKLIVPASTNGEELRWWRKGGYDPVRER